MTLAKSRRAPNWTEAEFETLLKSHTLPDADLARLVGRSLGAIGTVRSFVHSTVVVASPLTPSNRPSPRRTVRLKGALLVQRGRPILFTAATAEALVRHAAVDTYDPETGAGYQRTASAARIRAAAHYYENGGRMPNPLLVNIREGDFPRIRITVTDGDAGGYEEAIESQGDWIGAGDVEIPMDLTLWIYDGQHREGGIESLVNQAAEFHAFPVPLSITLGLSQTDEMKEFYEVNTNAKSVKTDLAWELLRQMAKNDPDLADALDMSGKDWITRGIEVAKLLDSTDGPWAERIQAPNEKKVRSDRLTMAQAQFVQSLKPILDMPVFQKADPTKIAQVINAYWRGVAQILPEPFEPTTNPKEWVIQKGPGAYTLHRVFPRVFETVRARGGRLGDPSAYAEVLKGLRQLSGEITDEETGEVEPVVGPDYWRAGARGIAGAYTGEAGRKRLFLMVQALLPRPLEEIEL